MIYLMRHGESTINLSLRMYCRSLEGDLTEKGREQVRKAGHWLVDKQIKAIYHSPFHRAEQSAVLIGEILEVAPQMDDDLREIDCGDLEGREDMDASDAWLAMVTRWRAGAWEAGFPGGETFRMAHDRLKRALLRANEENTLLVTHGGICVNVIPYLCVNAAALQRIDRLDQAAFVILERYDLGRFSCESWNLIEHFS
jgi:broad specificity phosphatase PhoE